MNKGFLFHQNIDLKLYSLKTMKFIYFFSKKDFFIEIYTRYEKFMDIRWVIYFRQNQKTFYVGFKIEFPLILSHDINSHKRYARVLLALALNPYRLFQMVEYDKGLWRVTQIILNSIGRHSSSKRVNPKQQFNQTLGRGWVSQDSSLWVSHFGFL